MGKEIEVYSKIDLHIEEDHILDRIKALLDLKKDSELAKYFGLSSSNISVLRRNGFRKIDEVLIKFLLDRTISTHRMVTKKGRVFIFKGCLVHREILKEKTFTAIIRLYETTLGSWVVSIIYDNKKEYYEDAFTADSPEKVVALLNKFSASFTNSKEFKEAKLKVFKSLPPIIL